MELRLCLRLHARLPPAVPPPFPAPAALPASLRIRTGKDFFSAIARCFSVSLGAWLRQNAGPRAAVGVRIVASGSYAVTLRRRARRPAIRAAIADGAQVVTVKKRSVSVILLSGGQGKRMGHECFFNFSIRHGDVDTEPLHFVHSLKTFCQLKEVKEVVVVCEPDYIDVFEGSIEDLQIPIKFARPGKERQDSVFNGLQEIDGDSELVCVHDSARPLVSSEDVKKVLEDAAEHGAAVLGVPVKAIIKEASSDSFVVKTLDRKTLWEMQTPQVMKPNLLKDGFELVKRDGLEVTDDVSIVEYLKHPVYITEGSYTNIKVTTPDDMLLAERLMSDA
nr:unnamed protein product [Digitaria exilis]